MSGYPDPPNLIADTVAGTLNGTPWPWVFLWNNVAYSDYPGNELAPIRIDSYVAGGTRQYVFGGSFILPFVGENPTGQVQTEPIAGNLALVEWSGQFSFSIFMEFPAYVYGAGYHLSVSFDVQTAFALNVVTRTVDGSGHTVSEVPTSASGHLQSGVLQAFRYMGAANLPADVDIDLSTADPFVLAPGANPFGNAYLGPLESTIARWITLTIDDPDTGEAITMTYGADGGPIAVRSDGLVSYSITGVTPGNSFAACTYPTYGYTFGQRIYTPAPPFGHAPNYGDPYISVPDINQLTFNRILNVNVVRIAYPQSIVPPPPGMPTVEQSGYFPYLSAALSLPAGGGSPRLALTSSRTYRAIDIAQSYDANNRILTRTVTRTYTTSCIRFALSTDLGETFGGATDIDARALDGTTLEDGLTGTDTVVETYGFNGAVFYLLGVTYGPAWPYSYAHAVSILLRAHGGPFINGGMLDPTTRSGPLYSSRQWACARLTDDSSGRNGWRDCATPNIATNSNTFGLCGNGAFWLTRGGYDGVRGAGGHSGGPALMGHASEQMTPTLAVSSDGGDSWRQAPLTSPYVPRTSSPAHQRGVSTDGYRISAIDFLGPQGDILPGVSYGTIYLLAGADGETIREASVSPDDGAIAIRTCRAPLTDPVWTTKSGPVLLPDPSLPVAGFTWQQRCVLAVCLAADVIAVYASDDDCGTWRELCWSGDNMASWCSGGDDA